MCHIPMGLPPILAPKHICNHNIGTPIKKDKIRNWTIKFAPKWMLKILNLDMLKRPMVQQLVASVRLMAYGHLCFVVFVLHVSGSSESSWSREEAPVAAEIVGICRCCCVALCGFGFRGNSLRCVRVLEIIVKLIWKEYKRYDMMNKIKEWQPCKVQKKMIKMHINFYIFPTTTKNA